MATKKKGKNATVPDPEPETMTETKKPVLPKLPLPPPLPWPLENYTGPRPETGRGLQLLIAKATADIRLMRKGGIAEADIPDRVAWWRK